MKKSILFFALALMGVTFVNAQKQIGSDKNFEFTFAPLGGNPVGIQGIRGRMFNSDGTGAIRIGLFVGGTSETVVTLQPLITDDEQPEITEISKTFDFSIRPGYEKHFDGTDRVSPYVGAELFFGMGSETFMREYYSPNDEENDDENVVWDITSKNGHTTLGLNILAGFDFYFVDNLYFGAEMGFGFSSTKEKDLETEVSDNDAFIMLFPEGSGDSDFPQPFTNEDGEVEFHTVVGDGSGGWGDGSSGGWKMSGWGPNVQGTIRLGVLIN